MSKPQEELTRVATDPVRMHPLQAPADDMYKPRPHTDAFWPAVRARNMLKEVSRGTAPRQNFDKNIRALASRLQMSPLDLLRTNPIVIGRRLGIAEHRLSQMIGNYYILSRNNSYFV